MPYNTVAEADSYFSSRYGYDKWAGLSDIQKEAALVSGSQIMDQFCTWNGEKTDEDQEGQFPRDGQTEVPEEVKTSELEVSYLIVFNGSASTTIDDSLTSLAAGSVKLSFNASVGGNPLVNPLIKSLLKPFGQCDFNMGGGSTKQIPVYRG